MYFINKAINIDSENVLYWKRYGNINFRLNLYEEAEVGYRKTLELGNYELNSWLTRNDILLKLGELEAAKNNLFQAKEFYEESAEIEYRLAGLFFKNLEFNKGEFHLKNALKLDSEFLIIIEELFPKVYSLKKVKEIISPEYYKKYFGLIGYIVFISVIFFVMPENPDEVNAPINLVNEFRLMSVLGVTSFWASIGIILGLFWNKFDKIKNFSQMVA